jgi:short-subunit dehydrogenase
VATILITGATSGLGEALANEAADSGHKVIACGRNEDKLKQLESHSNITCVQFDATDQSATSAALANIKCDIAVINAGTCEYVDINNVEPDMFRRVFDINVFGAVNVTSALLPNLEKGNKLVFVDSMARLLPFTRSQAYGASKAALHYICKSFEVDLKGKGIAVQSMSPGFVETPLTQKNDFPMPMAISSQEAAKYMLKGILSNKSSIYFPRRFGAIVRLLNMLPQALQTMLCVKMRGSLKGSSSTTEKHSGQAD